MFGTYEYSPTPVLMSLWIKGPIILTKTLPKMDFNKCVCKMLVELIELLMEQKTVLSSIPIWVLNIISKAIPKTNKTEPITIEIFKYLVTSISFLIVWDNIKNNPKRVKNIMSLPFEDPIRKIYVIGLMIGFNVSVAKITPARIMNRNPTMIVLLSFIINNLLSNSLNK